MHGCHLSLKLHASAWLPLVTLMHAALAPLTSLHPFFPSCGFMDPHSHFVIPSVAIVMFTLHILGPRPIHHAYLIYIDYITGVFETGVLHNKYSKKTVTYSFVQFHTIRTGC